MINTLNNLKNLYINIGDVINVGNSFYGSTQNDSDIIGLYYNGNFLFASRPNMHRNLIEKYCTDMTLHQNDIIKKLAKEWENLNEFDRILTIDNISFIIKNNIIVVLYNTPNLDIKTILNQKFNIPIYKCNDNASQLTRLAKKKIITYLRRIY